MPPMTPKGYGGTTMPKATYGGGYVQYGEPALVAGKYDGVLASGSPQQAALMAGGRKSRRSRRSSYASILRRMGMTRRGGKSRGGKRRGSRSRR